MGWRKLSATSGQSHVSSLPEAVLLHILTSSVLSDNRTKAAILQTCRGWYHACSAAPSFWDPMLVLNGGKLHHHVLSKGAKGKLGFMAFLKQRKGVVRRLRLLTGTTQFGAFLPSVLRCFQGGALEDLSMELGAIRNYEPLDSRAMKQILQEVLRLGSLRALSMAVAHQSMEFDFKWAQLAALSSLTCLESLALAGGLEGVPAPGLFSTLGRLTALSLRQDCGVLTPAAPLLGGLSQLQRVELCSFRLDVPGPQLEAQWQQLRELVLRSVSAHEGEAGEEAGGAWTVLPRLPHLTALTVIAGLMAPLRSPAIACIARCPALATLRIGRYAEHALPDLQDGMLPALTRLRVSVAAELEALPPSWCQALAPTLQVLEVENCYRLALPRELSLLSNLSRLGVNHQRLESVPSALLPMTQLTRLSLCANTLKELAPGQYLRNLRELILFANAFTHIPTALGLATNLQLLDLTMNCDLELKKRDFETLGRLGTSLRRLLLQRWPGGGEGWCARAAPNVERRLRRLLPAADLVL